MAVALMHIQPSEFGLMRPADFSVALRVYNENENERLKCQGNLIRGLAWKIIVPWLKTKPKSLQSFWQMPWDNKPTAAEMTQEERVASINSFLKMINRDDGKEKPES